MKKLSFCLFLLASFYALPSWAAHACGGPGPDEYLVGQGPTVNGVTSYYVCEWRQQQSPQPQYQQAPPPRPSYWMSVMAHPDTTQVWAAKGYPSADTAQNAALDACTKAMGTGCYSTDRWSNEAYIAVVQDVQGYIYLKGAGLSQAQAEKAAMQECQSNADYDPGCRLLTIIGNSPNGMSNDFPSGGAARRLFGAVARPKGTAPPPWDDSAWLASGIRGHKAAEQAALGECAKKTGMECELRITVGEGLIARYVTSEGGLYWLNAPTLDAARQILNASRSQQKGLYLMDTFDVRKPRLAEIKVSEADSTPERGYFAAAKPADAAAEKAWSKRAVVTGKASMAEARAEAIKLCEAQSKSRCDSISTDTGIYLFRVIYRDDKGATVAEGFTEADARQRKDAACANQQCSPGTVIDLRKPVSIVVSY
jgi:hypothetical protein